MDSPRKSGYSLTVPRLFDRRFYHSTRLSRPPPLHITPSLLGCFSSWIILLYAFLADFVCVCAFLRGRHWAIVLAVIQVRDYRTDRCPRRIHRLRDGVGPSSSYLAAVSLRLKSRSQRYNPFLNTYTFACHFYPLASRVTSHSPRFSVVGRRPQDGHMISRLRQTVHIKVRIKFCGLRTYSKATRTADGDYVSYMAF
ncbi:hypothetical protein EDB89DRAFT_954787 [Lactarius sanguifluus]|nr:hypothetical protein EDB89DRAFT_954787 [Lactarius sanguifluus]